MNTKRLITLALGSLLLAAPTYLAAQDQDQGSVADAARKAQAAKKTAPKAKMTIDNDNLGTLTGTVNVVGELPAPAGDNKADSEKTPKTAAPGEKAPVKDEAYWREKFAAANKKLADDAHELDILQREFNLKQDQFYTDPTALLKQEYSRQDLNDSKAKIDAKAAVVDQDKADISNLEDELRQAGGDPGWAIPPAQPAPGESTPEQPAPAQPAPAPAPAPAPQK
jgi:chromosome segregation ATPase